MNHFFPNDQYVVLQSHAWIKGLFRIQERIVDFNVREWRVVSFRVYTVVCLLEVPLVEFCSSIRVYQLYLWKAIEMSHPFPSIPEARLLQSLLTIGKCRAAMRHYLFSVWLVADTCCCKEQYKHLSLNCFWKYSCFLNFFLEMKLTLIFINYFFILYFLKVISYISK